MTLVSDTERAEIHARAGQRVNVIGDPSLHVTEHELDAAIASRRGYLVRLQKELALLLEAQALLS